MPRASGPVGILRPMGSCLRSCKEEGSSPHCSQSTCGSGGGCDSGEGKRGAADIDTKQISTQI